MDRHAVRQRDETASFGLAGIELSIASAQAFYPVQKKIGDSVKINAQPWATWG
jgi:hypothetical protein